MDPYSLTSAIFKIIGFLGLVIVLAILVVRLSKRGFKTNKPHIYLQVIDSLPLGRDKAVCVIEAGKSLLLVGLTTNNISLLKEFSVDELEDVAELQQEENMNPQEDQKFLERLMDNISKKTKNCNKMKLFALVLVGLSLVLFASKPAFAASGTIVPDINITVDGQSESGGLITSLRILAALTVLTLAPAILILTTSFTRIVVVFSFLRAGLGTQQTPPNQVLIGLALLLTFFIMTPTWGEINEAAIAPYMEGEISAEEALDRGQQPVLNFMLRQTRKKDLELFAVIGESETPLNPEDMSLVQIVPAFAISELKTAFEIGFLLFLPFLVIDMVIASTLMSMGMLMLPPVLISLPFKILLFVLVDGWGLLTRSLISGFR
ncbi:MAG: flagellar type III secretion system pore protein FliP [Bacillota bacterium]|nr:flagellar type III secretion system pore protein FliP [Candidatus Fermentithermobacillaceae bacterium]